MVLKWENRIFVKEKKMKKIKPTTKRKIAGVVAVVLIAAMILSAVLPMFFRTAYADEPQQYTVEAQMGFNGAVKINGDMPVSIKVTNNSSKTFKGKVSVDMTVSPLDAPDPENKKKGVEFFSQLELGAGETKQIDGVIPVTKILDGYTVFLKDKKDKEVYSRYYTVVTDRQDSLWAAVMSDSDRTRNAVASRFTEFGSVHNLTRLIELKREDMDNIKDISLLIINDMDMNSFTQEELAKLKNWVKVGGVLAVGAEDGFEDKQWYNALISGAYGSQVEVGQSSAYGGYSGESMSMLKTVMASVYIDDYGKSMIEEAAYYLSTDEINKLVSLIMYYNARADLDPQDIADYFSSEITQNYINETGSTGQYSSIVNRLYNDVQYEGDFQQYNIAAQNDMTQPQTEGKTAQSFVIDNGNLIVASPENIVDAVLYGGAYIDRTNVTVPQDDYSDFDLEKPQEILGSIFLGVIMIYAVFIGPFLFLILRKRDKKEMAVKYIPMSALCLTGIIIICSLGSKFQRPLSSVMNIADATQGGHKDIRGAIVTAAPTKGKVNIKCEAVTNAHLIDNSWSDDRAYSASLTGFDYTFYDSTKWSTENFVYNTSIELNGPLSARITNYDYSTGEADVEITNNTGYDLEDVCVTGTNKSWYNLRAAKKLKNGETLTYSYDIDDLNQYPFGKNSKDRTAYDALSKNKRNAVSKLSGDEPMVMGFIKSDTAGDIKINGRKATKNEFTALYTYIDVSNYGVGYGNGGGTWDIGLDDENNPIISGEVR